MAKLEANFTIGHSANCLVVTPQGALSTDQIELIRESVLNQLQRGSIAAVVVNLAGVPIIDSVEFEGLSKNAGDDPINGGQIDVGRYPFWHCLGIGTNGRRHGQPHGSA